MNYSGNNGGFFHNVTAITAAIIGLVFCWPLLIPLNGLGQYNKVIAWNWVLELAWIIFVIWFVRWISRLRRTHVHCFDAGHFDPGELEDNSGHDHCGISGHSDPNTEN